MMLYLSPTKRFNRKKTNSLRVGLGTSTQQPFKVIKLIQSSKKKKKIGLPESLHPFLPRLKGIYLI
jgi:hypothetical protein